MSTQSVFIDKDSSIPLYQQLYEQLREDILIGAYRPGDKLAPIRKLASELGIARNTVETAYNQLHVEGYVSSRQGSGFTVLPISQEALLTNLMGHSAQAPSEIKTREFPYDFRYGSLRPGSFPADEWRRILNEILQGDFEAELASYIPPFGLFELRKEIAAYLTEERGVSCRPEQVIMASGTQQSIMRALDPLDPRKDVVAMENPGFPGARCIIQSLGYKIVPICSDSGPEVYLEDVANCGAKLIYTTPSHQFPCGDCMDMNTRLQLIKLAQEKDFYILEDNYDSEFRYNSQPVPSLQSIDQLGRVIYMGSFSKTLSPALRMSYHVMPARLLNQYVETSIPKNFCTVPWLEQKAMQLFMERGFWKRHIRRSLIANRKLRDMLVETITQVFSPDEVQIHTEEAGLFLPLSVNNNMTQEQLISAAAEAGVGITPSSEYWLDPSSAPERLVVLGFTAATEKAIKEGIPLLRKAWF